MQIMSLNFHVLISNLKESKTGKSYLQPTTAASSGSNCHSDALSRGPGCANGQGIRNRKSGSDFHGRTCEKNGGRLQFALITNGSISGRIDEFPRGEAIESCKHGHVNIFKSTMLSSTHKVNILRK